MNLNKYLSDKRLWSPADEGTPAGNDTALATETAGDPTPPAAPETPETPAPTPESPVAVDYSYLPEDVRGDDGLNQDAFKTHYEEMAAENARFKDGLEAVPEDGKYEFGLPDEMDFGELDLPEGFQVDLKTDDETMAPLFGKLGEWMHKHNIPGDAAQEVTGLLAQYEATKASQFHAAAKADFERLGSTDSARQARIGSAKRAIEAKLPAEQAKAIMAAATTFDGVRALETLFSPRGPGPTVPHTTGADLEKMLPSERLKVINQMQETK